MELRPINDKRDNNRTNNWRAQKCARTKFENKTTAKTHTTEVKQANQRQSVDNVYAIFNVNLFAVAAGRRHRRLCLMMDLLWIWCISE